MNPEVWGFSGWKFLYSIVLSYPDKPTQKDKIDYMMFLESIKTILPCEACRENYSTHFTQLPIERYLGSRSHLFTWLLRMNNKVNLKKNKPILDPEMVFHKYYGITPSKRHENLEEMIRHKVSILNSPKKTQGLAFFATIGFIVLILHFL